MPILVDASETRTTSLLPDLGGRLTKGLEELTGADLMVSPLSLPACNQAMIKKHIEAGCLLVQGKWSMGDLEDSIHDEGRLSALARMAECGATPRQRVLLYVSDGSQLGA